MSGWVGLDELLTAEEVAEVLRADSVKTVARLRKQGHLRAVRVGRTFRYDRRDVADYIERARSLHTTDAGWRERAD